MNNEQIEHGLCNLLVNMTLTRREKTSSNEHGLCNLLSQYDVDEERLCQMNMAMELSDVFSFNLRSPFAQHLQHPLLLRLVVLRHGTDGWCGGGARCTTTTTTNKQTMSKNGGNEMIGDMLSTRPPPRSNK